MPYSDQEAFLNAYLKNYAKAQQNAINSGKTGMSSARYTGQQAMNAAPTTLPDYGDIANSFTTAYTKQLAAVEAQREKEAKAAQAAAEKEARAAASAAKKASSSTTKSKKLKKEELKALDSELEEMAKTRVALQERKETQDTNTRERIKENVGDTAGISSLTAASRTFAPERKGSATKKRLSQRLAAGVKGLAKGASTYKQMQKARGGVSAEDSVDLGGDQTPQATAAKQRSRTKTRASVAKQSFTTQELDARLTATNQRMRELQKQGKTQTREYRQLQNQHDTYATALGVDSFAGRAGATGLGAVSGFAAGLANMGDATARAIRGQSASMDIPEYEAASNDLQEANEQRDALIQMGRAYTDTPNGPVATPEFQQVLDRIASAKGVRAENQVTPERNQVVSDMLDFAQNQNQKAQAGLDNTGRFVVGTIGSVAQNLPAFAAAAAVPEAAPVLIPTLMGVSAAGNRENELEQRGVPLNQAVLRSGLSGAVSAITNKLPLEQGAELMAGNGPGLVRAMARQALSEGGQEASEYAADYGLDVLAGDPDANFSLAELGQQALGGALGGAISAAGSSLIGSGVNRLREAQENAPVDTDVQQAEPVSPDTEAARQPLEAGQEALPGLDAVVDAYHNGNLTNAQIEQLKPGGELRQAFEEATGVKLPDTSSETRKTLKAEAQIQTIPTLSEDAGYVPAGYHAEDPGYIGGATSRDIAAEITGKDGKSVYTRQLADIRDRFLDAVQNGEDTSTIEQEAQALAEKIFPESAFVENTDTDYVRALREALKKPVRVTDAELSDLENALGATRTEINRRYGLNLVKAGDSSTSGLDQAVMELGEAFPDVDLFAHPADAFAEIVQKYDQLKDGVQAVDTESMKAARAYVADHILYGDSLDAAMAREAQTEAFDNFENSPYTETNAMQDGGEEVGTRGGYGRRNLDGVDFSEDDRRAEGKAPEKPAFSGKGSANTGVPEQVRRVPGGGTPERVREINGHRYTYGQPDAADYTAPVRTAADYAKQRYGLDVDVSDGPAYVDGNEHNSLMFTLPDGTIVVNNAAALDPDTVTAMIDHEVMHNIQHKNHALYARVDAALKESGVNPNAYREGTDLYEVLHGYDERNPDFMDLDNLPKFRRELSAQIAGYAYRPELAKSIFGDFVDDFDTVFDTVRSVLDERAQLGQQESGSQGSTAATTIPELMPTQRVQELIPTLEDHPNTVGAAQRQFDRPEVSSQSHMTRDTDNDYLQPLVQRDQGGEQKFTHERVSNADRMKIAANSMETESRDEIVSRLTSKEQWDADDTALAGSVLREWDSALGDMDKSGEAYKQALAQKMKFTQRISESNTMNAQALQMTQEFTTPETAVMQSQKNIKTAVDRVANGKNKRKFDQYKSDVETAIANAEDTATQKANDAVQKAIETVRQQVADETDQPSVEDVLGRKLAAAVNRYATDGKEASVEDVVQSEMLSQLTKMATSDTEKGARPKKPKLTVEQKLQTALDNQETYTQAWEAAKEALVERYKDNADMSSRLQAFFNDAGESGLYGKDTIKQLVSKYTKDQGIDFKTLVKKGRRDKQSTLREIQERIQDTFDMDDTQAQRIAEMAMNEYSKALSEAADANLKAIRGGKGKTSKSTHDQFLGLLRMGIYDNEDVKAYAASKFGVQPLTAEQCQQILDLAERAEQLPANSRDRVLLESEAATIAARNLSGSFHDAWDVWRYTSMLFNARTNEKNIGGNVSMGLNARTKDVVLAAMEWMINKVAPGKVERTTAIVTPFTENGRALLAASANDADLNSYRQLSGTSERMNLARDMQRHREAFRSLASPDSNNIVTKFLSGLDSLAARASAPLEVSDYEGAFGVLEGLRGINKNMDAAIDWIRASAESATNKGVLGVAGLKNNYAWSLAQYLKANGADASIFDATDAQSLALLDKARAHAIQQALINTYHAESKTASAVAKFKADLRGSDNFASRVLGDIVEGQLPFVKTPINVAKQSLQYSPLGFVSTAAEGIKVARGTGDVNLMLDHAAASVTGSLLFALGGILAEKGLLTAGIGDDEKDKANLEGRQEYSLQLVDDDGKLHSYTIDWANAAAIPMFAGAEYAKLAASDGASLNSVASASQQVLEPLLEMSFLQGLNDNLESLRYSEDPYIYGMAKQSLSSYATQGIPTLVGQVARSIDPVRRSTYSGTTGIESDIGYTANKIRNKIPFLSETGQPYIDAFGDTQPNTGGSFAGRLAYNMLSPGYYGETTDDPVKQGVLDLANSSGDNSVIPEVAEKKVVWTSDKERHSYQLSPQEYTDFATQQGQLRKDMAEAVLDSRYTEEQQVELIPELYSTAGKITALDIVPDFSVGTEERKRIDIYNQYGIDGLMNWIAYRKYANTDGKTGINQSEARAWLNDSDMSETMKDAFWAASSSNWKSSR